MKNEEKEWMKKKDKSFEKIKIQGKGIKRDCERMGEITNQTYLLTVLLT